MVMINFIDFRKAFDCLHRPSMCSILRQYGIPDTIVAIIQNLYKGSRSCVELNGVCGDWFEVVTGVRQGCILLSLLFAILIDWVMKKSLTKFPRRTGMSGWQQALQPRLYADDTSHMGMQLMTEEVKKISRRVGLRMNAGRCKIMVSNNWEDSTVITAEGTNVEEVETFVTWAATYREQETVIRNA